MKGSVGLDLGLDVEFDIEDGRFSLRWRFMISWEEDESGLSGVCGGLDRKRGV